MSNYREVMPHGNIQKIFDDIYFVTGTMSNEFFGSDWQFSRNMTVVREDGKLSLINTVRLNEDGLKELESLGDIVNIVRIGDMHGVDDPFYVDRYKATFWAVPGMGIQDSLSVDKELHVGGEMPISDANLFVFKTVQRPEAILRLDREGGIMIACDSLQNWIEPDEYFKQETIDTMKSMDFFKTANLGPAWMHGSQPSGEDFVRLKELSFNHALCGHGYPLLNNAQELYHKTFDRIFNL